MSESAPWIRRGHACVLLALYDEDVEKIVDAVDDVLSEHDMLDIGSECSCGARNNMDGDVLHSHRISLIDTAIRKALGFDDD